MVKLLFALSAAAVKSEMTADRRLERRTLRFKLTQAQSRRLNAAKRCEMVVGTGQNRRLGQDRLINSCYFAKTVSKCRKTFCEPRSLQDETLALVSQCLLTWRQWQIVPK